MITSFFWWQGPWEVDYEEVQPNRGGATQMYHLKLLKAWREAVFFSGLRGIWERGVWAGGAKIL